MDVVDGPHRGVTCEPFELHQRPFGIESGRLGISSRRELDIPVLDVGYARIASCRQQGFGRIVIGVGIGVIDAHADQRTTEAFPASVLHRRGQLSVDVVRGDWMPVAHGQVESVVAQGGRTHSRLFDTKFAAHLVERTTCTPALHVETQGQPKALRNTDAA